MITLTCSSIDDEEEVSLHASACEAIEAAVKWFSDGYEDMPEVNISDDTDRLREDLSAGREFFCAKFGERISLRQP